jgi:methionyl-tRNA formyltransferase
MGTARPGPVIRDDVPLHDAGPILSQAAISLTDDDDIDTLAGPFFDLVPQALHAALERVEKGDPGDPQNEDEAIWAMPFEPEWLSIDWTKPARDIHLQVRSWWGNRGATCGAVGEIDSVLTRVIKTRLVTEDGQEPAAPGSVLARVGDSLLIQCGDHPLRILSHQPEPHDALD